MKIKLTVIGPMKASPKDPAKTFREIGAEQFAGEMKSAWATAKQFDGLKPGDEVEVTLSENGKYINKVELGGAVPTQGAGGKAWSKPSYSKPAFVPDPEKNTSVYTSYVLEHMIDWKGLKLTPEAAVQMVFKIRNLVQQALAGTAPKEPL